MRRLAFALFASLVLVACAPSKSIRFEDMHIVLTPSPVLGLYGTIRNDSDEPLTIDKVVSKRFKRIDLHHTIVAEDRMRMEPIDSFKVPVRGAVNLSPDGIHAMLFEATEPVKEGEIIAVTVYVNGAPHALEVLVRSKE